MRGYPPLNPDQLALDLFCKWLLRSHLQGVKGGNSPLAAMALFVAIASFYLFNLGFHPRPDEGLSAPQPGPASAGPVL